MKAWVGFLVMLLVVSGGAAVLAMVISSDPLLVRAVAVSATVATVVQLAGFSAAKYLLGLQKDLFVAWGGAVAIRFVSLCVYAVVLYFKRMLPAAPALITFAVLLLVTSIVEPLFLKTE